MYTGPWWSRIMEDCNLITVDRKTSEVNTPRIIRVRSYSVGSETVRVRMLRGQTVKQWIEATEALAVALDADRIGIEKVSPRIIDLVVQHDSPFSDVILPLDVPTDSDEVDLTRVWLGETENGTDWIEAILGQHILVSGASGSGKNSPIWNMLLACAPLIRDGLVRLHVANPKGTELNALAPVSHRYAEDDDEIAEMIRDFWTNTVADKKTAIAAAGLRKFQISRETPFDILILDEIGAITGYGNGGVNVSKRELQQYLALILSQARALGGTVIGALQEPDKQVLPQRDLFTVRIQLRATSSMHPDMVLGEDMRKRGALADEIPNVPETAGIGYVVRQRTRTPLQVRAAFCDDNDIKDIIRIAGWPMSEMETTEDSEVTDVNHTT